MDVRTARRARILPAMRHSRRRAPTRRRVIRPRRAPGAAAGAASAVARVPRAARARRKIAMSRHRRHKTPGKTGLPVTRDQAERAARAEGDAAAGGDPGHPKGLTGTELARRCRLW